jgi:RNA polymerase sigma factor (TIGR02999 family)
LAGRVLRKERPDHTLQKTALANEAIVKLLGSEALHVQDSHHLLAMSARQMRNILVDYGRAKIARKRGGGAQRVDLRGDELSSRQDMDGLLSLNAALEQLGEEDERALRVVELKYFTGFTTDETAEILGLSSATVEKVWHSARIWLHSRLTININRAF